MQHDDSQIFSSIPLLFQNLFAESILLQNYFVTWAHKVEGTTPKQVAKAPVNNFNLFWKHIGIAGLTLACAIPGIPRFFTNSPLKILTLRANPTQFSL